jgi:pimeloyl-ACP methyl ester carboxylesterase
VICHPFGQEYMRAHRALRELAERLAAGGFHVLRFDYSGCGDSAGESAEGTLEQWTRDIAAAMDEVRETSGAPRIGLVGLRLGATLAALLAAERDDIERLVLWAPIRDGAAYLRELQAAQDAWLRDHAHRERAGPATALEGEALGFEITPAVAASLQHLRLEGEALPASQVLVLDESAHPGAPVWSHADGMDRSLVPSRALESITGWLAAACS